MSKVQKVNSFLEKFWLIVASLATLATLIIGFIDGFPNVRDYALLTGLAWGIYLIRRGLRKRMERTIPESVQGNKK